MSLRNPETPEEWEQLHTMLRRSMDAFDAFEPWLREAVHEYGPLPVQRVLNRVPMAKRAVLRALERDRADQQAAMLAQIAIGRPVHFPA